MNENWLEELTKGMKASAVENMNKAIGDLGQNMQGVGRNAKELGQNIGEVFQNMLSSGSVVQGLKESFENLYAAGGNARRGAA